MQCPGSPLGCFGLEIVEMGARMKKEQNKKKRVRAEQGVAGQSS